MMIDCSAVKDRSGLHVLLARELSFPDYYGHNLDALMDCLTSICTPTHVRLLHWQELGQWKEGFENVFHYAMEENPNLTIEMM